jgi:hypothetical protein
MDYSYSNGLIILFVTKMVNLLNHYRVLFSKFSNTEIHHHFLLQIIQGGRKLLIENRISK